MIRVVARARAIPPPCAARAPFGLLCQLAASIVAAGIIAHVPGRRGPDRARRFARSALRARISRHCHRRRGGESPLRRLGVAILKRRLPALNG